MRRTRRILGALALSFLLAGCPAWPMSGHDPDRTAHNPDETTITAANAADLTQQWTWASEWLGEIGDPILSAGGVHVPAQRTCQVVTVDPATGEQRWASSSSYLGSVCGLWNVRLTDAYVMGDNVAVGVIGAGPAPHTGWSCEGESWAFDIDTGLGGSRQDGAALATRGDLTVAHDCAGDGVNEHHSLTAGTVGGTWQPLGIAHANQQVTIDAGSPSAYFTGYGLLASDPAALQVYGEGIRSYDITGAGDKTCGTSGTELCPRWATAVDGIVGPTVIFDRYSHLFVGTESGQLLAIPKSGGSPTVVRNTQSAVTAPPALAFDPAGDGDGWTYVPTASGLVVFKEPGYSAISWTAAVPGGVNQQPAVAGDVVYVTSADGTVAAFAADGCGDTECDPLWSVDTGDAAITGAPAVSQGQLYVGTADGRLIAFGLD